MKGRIKQQKGITLIALIITIVVLLILAGVAISSIQNDGILGYAQNAADSWNQAQKNEESVLNDYLTYLNGGVPQDLGEYILGENGAGKETSQLFQEKYDENGNPFYEWIDEEGNAREDITTIGYNWGASNRWSYYIKYNNAAFEVVIDGSYTKSITKVYEPQGREGQIVKYDSNEDTNTEDWMILTDRNGLLEIVSLETMGSTLELISSVTATTDLNGDDEVNNIDTAILSYNNAITTINDYCKSLITTTDNVRSVGGTNNNAPAYSSEKYNEWGKNIKVGLASGATQNVLDYVKLGYFGRRHLETPDGSRENWYWFASRSVIEYDSNVLFRVCSAGLDLCILHADIVLYDISAEGDEMVFATNDSLNVRPVIINPTGI